MSDQKFDFRLNTQLEIPDLKGLYWLPYPFAELGEFECDLEGRFSVIRTQECNLGNFICDIMVAATNADLAILNSGTLRSDCIHPAGTPVAKKIQPFASAWYEIRLLWPNIKPVKSHTTALGFKLQTDINQIFQMKYCASLCVDRLQKYLRSKLEIDKKSAVQLAPGASSSRWAAFAVFFANSNFGLKYFCRLLTYKDAQYIIWKICFVSVRRWKPKAVVWLLTGFM